MRRRKCQSCPLVLPPETTGDLCVACQSRQPAAPTEPDPPAVTPRGRSEKQKAHIARVLSTIHDKRRKATRIEAGLCQSCGERKPLNQFPPRTRREPKWYPHHNRCHECVCEQAKAYYRKRYFAKFVMDLPNRSDRNIASELKYLLQQVRAIRAEQERRAAAQERTA